MPFSLFWPHFPSHHAFSFYLLVSPDTEIKEERMRLKTEDCLSCRIHRNCKILSSGKDYLREVIALGCYKKLIGEEPTACFYNPTLTDKDYSFMVNSGFPRSKNTSTVSDPTLTAKDYSFMVNSGFPRSENTSTVSDVNLHSI